MPLELHQGMTRCEAPQRDIIPNPSVEPICKSFIEERYALLAYIYNTAQEASYSGFPMIRPMWFYHPEDPVSRTIDSQYYFGPSLLVSPITKKGVETWDVYLPKGGWYDYWSKDHILGGGLQTVRTSLEKIPVFVPDGSIIPKNPVVQFVDINAGSEPVELLVEVYSGDDVVYELYEDDGISMDYLTGVTTVTKFFWDDKKRLLKADGTSKLWENRERTIQYVVYPEKEKGVIKVNY